MSMHEIESLVESSVITVATASPIPPLARNICFNLYQLQNQLDCGYTVLRVREELEKLGYLFLLPPKQLQQPFFPVIRILQFPFRQVPHIS